MKVKQKHLNDSKFCSVIWGRLNPGICVTSYNWMGRLFWQSTHIWWAGSENGLVLMLQWVCPTFLWYLIISHKQQGVQFIQQTERSQSWWKLHFWVNNNLRLSSCSLQSHDSCSYCYFFIQYFSVGQIFCSVLCLNFITTLFPFPLANRLKSCWGWTHRCQRAKANHLFSGSTRPRRE